MCVCVCEPLVVFNRPPPGAVFFVGLLAGCDFEDFFSFERGAPKLFFRRVVFRHTISHKQKKGRKFITHTHIKHIKHIKHE